MADSHDSNVSSVVADAWRRIDPNGLIRTRIRPDGLAELVAVSSLFDGKDSSEREELFWPALRDLSRDTLMRMTYSLLLTPAEAAGYFAGETGRNVFEGDR